MPLPDRCLQYVTRSKSSEAVRRGALAQHMAALFLQLNGLKILDANRRAGGGEIDLLAREGRTLVFVEVRMRGAGAWGSASASVDERKQRRLRACAQGLLRREDGLSWPGRELRFDLVALDLGAAECRIRHLRGILG